MAEQETDELRRYASTIGAMLGQGSSRRSIEVTRRVEAKAAVLLSHVSLMIAVTGVLWAAAGAGSRSEWLFALELVSYLVLAIACILIQFERNPRRALKFGADPTDAAFSRSQDTKNIAESRWKMNLLIVVQSALPILTFILVLTIIWFVFGGEISRLFDMLPLDGK